MIRANMLNGFWVSYRLPELPDWTRTRLGELIDFYRRIGRRFVREADMHRLTGQTERDGKGGTWNAYLYLMEEAEEAMRCVFRLAGAEPSRVCHLEGLKPAGIYEIRSEDHGFIGEMSGEELAKEGLQFSVLEEEASDILLLRPKSQ